MAMGLLEKNQAGVSKLSNKKNLNLPPKKFRRVEIQPKRKEIIEANSRELLDIVDWIAASPSAWTALF
jgi:hypothetical protein